VTALTEPVSIAPSAAKWLEEGAHCLVPSANAGEMNAAPVTAIPNAKRMHRVRLERVVVNAACGWVRLETFIKKSPDYGVFVINFTIYQALFLRFGGVTVFFSYNP
jgi:hypothetical protein